MLLKANLSQFERFIVSDFHCLFFRLIELYVLILQEGNFLGFWLNFFYFDVGGELGAQKQQSKVNVGGG